MKNKTFALIIAIIIIVTTIALLEKSHVQPMSNGNKVEVQGKDNDFAKVKAARYPKAIELVQPDGYINGDNTTISQYVGKKVVLVDFWTYTCVNCIRTLPYLNAWYDKYKDQGLVIIGVHSPEFEFEKDFMNVQNAVKEYNISYPVVLDNNHQTWSAYENQYWPAEYLIDIDGFIVHTSFGEGNYDDTEKEIQRLLQEKKDRDGSAGSIDDTIVHPVADTPDFNQIQSPEIYLGYAFSRNQFGSAQGYSPENTVNYTRDDVQTENAFYLVGPWNNQNDHMRSEGNAEIYLKYNSRQVNLVAGATSPVVISVFIDNKFVKNITISDHALYQLYEDDYAAHDLKIVTPQGLQAYTFTFG